VCSSDLAAEAIHMRMDNIKPATCRATGSDSKQKHPHPTGQPAWAAQRYVREPEFAFRIIFARKHGDVVPLREFSHQLNTVGFGSSEPVAKAVYNKGNFEAASGIRGRRRVLSVHLLRRLSSIFVMHFCRKRIRWVDRATITLGSPKGSSFVLASPPSVVVAFV